MFLVKFSSIWQTNKPLMSKSVTLTLLVNIVDIVKVVHVGEEHGSLDNCREQSQKMC